MKSLILLGTGCGLGVTAIVTGLTRHSPAGPVGLEAIGTLGVAGADRSWAHEAPATLQPLETIAPGPQRARSI